MTAYLMSDELPTILHFDDIAPSDLRDAAIKWLENGKVLAIGTDAGEGAGFATMLLHMGRISSLSVLSELSAKMDRPILKVEHSAFDTLR